ncbi:MAG: 16S rRNA (cytidine(1402)-2'-O)-methyltransferase [Gammaproteobacteria bacterium]|nr:16S rRNA (cytidine(1402)-2'-O)-methyltransferase [Gammaproteobacteria bacterium]
MEQVIGKLYVVATPIGNLADISQRALDVLRGVDLIAAEDTRHSARLLEAYMITTPLKAYHDHNEEYQSGVLLKKLLAGENVALISDAGTPLINDPGYRLLSAVHDAGVQVIPIPGANAAIALLSVSGLAVNSFTFEGFPPVKSQQRKDYYAKWLKSPHAHVFYESSHRIVASLNDALTVLGGERMVTMGRELTKTFETIKRCSLAQLVDFVAADNNQQKGEFVMVVSRAESDLSESDVEIRQMLEKVLPIVSVKQASQVVAALTGQKKNKIYQLALEMQQD